MAIRGAWTRWRFGLRGMLVVVALLALGFALVTLRGRQMRHRALAEYHAAHENAGLQRAAMHAEVARGNEAEARRLREALAKVAEPGIRELVENLERQAERERAGEREQRKQAEQHGALRRRHAEAARRLWGG